MENKQNKTKPWILIKGKTMNLQEETIIVLETGPIYSIKGKGGRQKEDLETFFPPYKL